MAARISREIPQHLVEMLAIEPQALRGTHLDVERLFGHLFRAAEFMREVSEIGTGIVIKNGYLYASSDDDVYRYKLNAANEVADADHPERHAGRLAASHAPLASVANSFTRASAARPG